MVLNSRVYLEEVKSHSMTSDLWPSGHDRVGSHAFCRVIAVISREVESIAKRCSINALCTL
jgi:hypothetical protein